MANLSLNTTHGRNHKVEGAAGQKSSKTKDVLSPQYDKEREEALFVALTIRYCYLRGGKKGGHSRLSRSKR